MQTQAHTMSELFSQLGLPSDQESIDAFIDSHRPLGRSAPFHCASFWSPSQRTFFQEEFIEDADWIGVIDELNLRLSQKPGRKEQERYATG